MVSFLFPLSAMTTPMFAVDPLVLFIATASPDGLPHTSCPCAFGPRSFSGALVMIASLLSSFTKYALAATGAESATARASRLSSVVCWRIDTRACALMNGVKSLPKIHGTFFSVIFTSTAPSLHGFPLRPESPGLA